jgi:sugar-specific transcriptional regulator TrmB
MERPNGSLLGLGLGEDDERIYRLLVAGGPATAAELAQSARLEADAVIRSLERLHALELATEDEDDPGRTRPTAPHTALGDLVRLREHELNRARTALEELTAVHRHRVVSTGPDQAEAVLGSDEVGRWVRHLQDAAGLEIRAFVKPPYVAVGPGQNTAGEIAVLERGVRSRVLVERPVLADPRAHGELVASLERGQELRVASELPVKLLIADRALALVSLDAPPEGRVGALAVRSGGLLEALIALFEQTWDRAARVRPDLGTDPGLPQPPVVPVPVDQRILNLQLPGPTDDAVAGQLGMGRRTVQRRLRALMDAAGVTSRIQLGWHARDRGWL